MASQQKLGILSQRAARSDTVDSNNSVADGATLKLII